MIAHLLAALNFCLAWCAAHPAQVTMVVGALASLFYKKLDKYPRAHAFFEVLAGLGVNLPVIVDAVSRIFTGKVAKLAATVGASTVIVLCFVGCGSATTAAKSPTAAADARAAVHAADDVWQLVAKACTDYSQTQGDAGLAVAAKCDDFLTPAHALIVGAAVAVDTNWTTNDACNLAKGLSLLVGASTSFPLPAIDQQFAADTLVIATALAGVECPADAGAE